MAVSRLAIAALVASLQTATGLALRGGRRATRASDSIISPPHQVRALDRLDDRSESFDGFDDDIDADRYTDDYQQASTGVNPDSGDEEYVIQDWLDDPSTSSNDGITSDGGTLIWPSGGNVGADSIANANNTGNATIIADSCITCTNVPTTYMRGNSIPCANYSFAYTNRCSTADSWWGRDGNVEHCQYSCWTNNVPFASQGDKPCCDRDDGDDEDWEYVAFPSTSNSNVTATYSPDGTAYPWLEEPGNGLGEGMLNVCQGDW